MGDYYYSVIRYSLNYKKTIEHHSYDQHEKCELTKLFIENNKLSLQNLKKELEKVLKHNTNAENTMKLIKQFLKEEIN